MVLLVGAARIGTLGAYPLMDTTESRYAEVAREMVVYDDWITPRIDGGQPFWAKPPLSMWATMMSFHALGFSEFAARLGSVIISICTLTCVVSLGRRLSGSALGWRAALILLSTVGFFTVSGAVMTDAALVAAVTLALTGFGIAMHAQDKRSRVWWGYAFFAGLGLTMLAKGPIGLVLSGFPIVAWCLIHRRFSEPFQRLPWKTGSFLSIAIAAPWYIAAERATPGFLHYFIVGEHFQRFLESGWEGDLYGNAHSEVPGTIWVFALIATLPWALLLPWLVPSVLQNSRHSSQINSTWSTYLVLWTLTPMIFFTPARNILPSYVAPGLPAFALLCAGAWEHLSASEVRVPRFAVSRIGFMAFACLVPLIAVLVGVPVARHVARDTSHKHVAELVNEGTVERIVYVRKLPYSAQCYTNGRVSKLDLDHIAELPVHIKAPGVVGVAVERKREHLLPDAVRELTTPVMEAGDFIIFVEHGGGHHTDAE